MFERLRRRRERRTDARIRREFEYVSAARTPLRDPLVMRIAAYAVAVAVHSLTAALFGVAGWVWLTGLTTAVKVLVSVLLVALGFVVAPHPPRRQQPGWRVHDAPALFAAMSSVAEAVGVRAPRRVIVTSDLDASYDGRVLSLGLPVWRALSADAKPALLARGLAKGRRDDARRSPVLTSAARSLLGWLYLLQPDVDDARRRSRRRMVGFMRPATSVHVADLLLPVVLAPLFVVVTGLLAALRASMLTLGQRAGYRAVARAAAAAGTAAVAELLVVELMAERIIAETSLAVRRGDSDGVDVAGSYLRGLDSAIVEAVRARHRSSTFTPADGGPPAVLLEAFVHALPPVGPPAGLVDVAAVDAELARVRPDVARDLRDATAEPSG